MGMFALIQKLDVLSQYNIRITNAQSLGCVALNYMNRIIKSSLKVRFLWTPNRFTQWNSEKHIWGKQIPKHFRFMFNALNIWLEIIK